LSPVFLAAPRVDRVTHRRRGLADLALALLHAAASCFSLSM
jgi:hypothetical protein